MDILNILVEAQKGNNKSYELLCQELKNNPGIICELFQQLSVKTIAMSLRELLGIFIKNLLNEDTFKTWWRENPEKLKIINFLLEIDDIPKIISLILSSILAIEAISSDMSVLNQIMTSNNISAVVSIGYFIEGSRTIPQILANYTLEILPVLLTSDKLLGLKLFQQCSSHLPSSPSINLLIKLICEQASSDNNVIVIEVYKCLVDIALNFYDFLKENLQKLVELTIIGINSNQIQVISLSIEFWNAIIDAEKQRIEENTMHYGYIQKYYESIISEIMKKIIDTEETDYILIYCSTIEGISEVIHDKIA